MLISSCLQQIWRTAVAYMARPSMVATRASSCGMQQLNRSIACQLLLLLTHNTSSGCSLPHMRCTSRQLLLLLQIQPCSTVQAAHTRR
jgi:hypothetical protein